ncbi:glycosyl transferase family 36 [candidate division KSB1 bacterium]|nr:glycosyl transferase family 36 [candidate division KSB1 bacterium]
MHYGRFQDDGKEYLIENVATPMPWINYLQNGEYFASISNNGGGISYFKNSIHGRITRYRINDLPYDRPGKYLYVKDRDAQDYWSLTWQPVGRKREAYRVAHGFGYTRVQSEVAEIAASVLFFVPRTDPVEIWRAVLQNKSQTRRRLSIYGYVEFCLGHALVDLINQCDDQHFNRLYFDPELNTLFATKTYWLTGGSTQQQENKAWNQWAFFTANLPVTQYETMRERFIGPFRNETNPIALEKGELSSQDTDFGNTVGALRVDLELAPDETQEIIFNLGVIPKAEFAQKKQAMTHHYRQAQHVDQALAGVKKYWDDFLSHVVVETPDVNTNIFLNYWTPYQAKVAFDVGRIASFYYWGISRGFGFRDTAQDTIAVTISQPGKARERVFLLARQMFSDGHVYHHFYGDGHGETTRHCDDPLWFILAVTDYLKETGDLAILEQTESFADQKSGTILDHLLAVVEFVRHKLGPHHLPIFGRGDWNDTLDYIGGADGGESVWGGMFYVVMLNYLLELLTFLKLTEKKPAIESLRDQIQHALDTHCWDGAWFIRAFGEKNKKIGSQENEAGKIFLNTQSWAVIANVSARERLIQAMDSVKKHLDTAFGPKICAPAFTQIDPNIGLVTRCVAGKKENAAVFCHPVTWAIQAECLLGRGDEAFHYYQKTLPNAVDSDTFRVEPYVYSQYITSDEHSTAGMASHSWQTGTAAWMYRVCIDYLLGVRATYQGLRIDPAIPSHWSGFKMKRVYRQTVYQITVENPAGKAHGVKQVFVDGQPIAGHVLPISTQKECQVRVVMG